MKIQPKLRKLTQTCIHSRTKHLHRIRTMFLKASPRERSIPVLLGRNRHVTARSKELDSPDLIRGQLSRGEEREVSKVHQD